MTIDKLKPDMIVFDVRPAKGFMTTHSKWSTWTVKILSVDLENRKVEVSWNGNPPYTVGERIWKKYRLKKPSN